MTHSLESHRSRGGGKHSPLPIRSRLGELPTLPGLGLAGLLPVDYFTVADHRDNPFQEKCFGFSRVHPEPATDSIWPLHFRAKEETTIQSFFPGIPHIANCQHGITLESFRSRGGGNVPPPHFPLATPLGYNPRSFCIPPIVGKVRPSGDILTFRS